LHEAMLREHISAKIKRGKLECRVTLTADKSNTATTSAPTIDETALKGLVNALAHVELIAKAQIDPTTNAAISLAPFSALDLLRWPGIYSQPDSQPNTQPDTQPQRAIDSDLSEAEPSDPEKIAIAAIVDLAIDAYIQSRLREGQQTANVMLGYASQMATLVDSLSQQLPAINKELLQKFSDKAIERLTNHPNSELKLNTEEALARINQELVLLALRADVSEEIARLNSHLAELRNTLAGAGPVGKKLDFLMQEFNREANTLGSKAPSLEVSRVAIDLKLLIEQIREQVQNLE
jgi:uncharacterized protein (TIGR00255 family)